MTHSRPTLIALPMSLTSGVYALSDLTGLGTVQFFVSLPAPTQKYGHDALPAEEVAFCSQLEHGPLPTDGLKLPAAHAWHAPPLGPE